MPDDVCNNLDSRSRPLRKRFFIRAACCLSIPSLVLVWFGSTHVQQLTGFSTSVSQAPKFNTTDLAKTLPNTPANLPHAPKPSTQDHGKAPLSVLASAPDATKHITTGQEKTRSDNTREKDDDCSINRVLQDTSVNKIQQHCKDGPFGASLPGSKRRLAIMVRGESFRGGGLHDRRTNVNNRSFTCQKKAVDTQVELLIEPFEACGFQVDVYLFTWKTPPSDTKGWPYNSSQQLIDMYRGRVAFAGWLPPKKLLRADLRERHDPQRDMFTRGFNLMAEHSKRLQRTYDALLVVRFDLVFKQKIGRVNYNKVLFAFVQSDPGWGVADVIHWVPWRYVNCIYLDGFRQHYSYQIIDRIGRANVDFMVHIPHDSNSNQDINPLFKQCRAEQRYDIHGGHTIMMFGIRPVHKDMVQQSADSFYRSLYLQGVPRSVPPTDLVLHMWKAVNNTPKGVNNVPWTYPVGSRALDTLTLEIGWQAASESIRRCFKMATHTIRYKDKTKWRAMFHQPEYHLERLVYVRFDFVFVLPYMSVYRCNVESRVCVGYGGAGTKFAKLPVIIIASEAASARFLQNSAELEHMVLGRRSNATGFLRESFGLPIDIICTRC